MSVHIEVKGIVFEKFKEFEAIVKTQLKYKINVFWLDNGDEFILKRFNRFLKKYGIEKQSSIPYRPQQNKVVEWENHTIVELTRSIIHTQEFNKSFWTKAMMNLVYTCKWCPLRFLLFITSEEAWSGRRPYITYMCVLWCITCTMSSDEQRSKLDTKGS